MLDTKMKVLLLVALFSLARSEVFFQDKFADGDEWESRWVLSEHSKDNGKFLLSAGKYFSDKEEDKGLKTSEDAKFYAISAKFPAVSNKDKTFVAQLSVKHEQNIDCGGGYIKLFPSSLDQKDMHGESPYAIMFGPDICGPGTKKVHVIFNYNGKNHLIKKDIRCKDDVYTHVYTLILKSDNTYEVLIDNEKVESGDLEGDWDMLPPKTIKDPEAKKPEDWDDREKIDDPEDKKPEDWDQPEHIPDPDATKPEDWNEDMDGEWEPPMIDNPDYKGEWKPRQIDNPEYKGKWVHPMIDNPEYEADDTLYLYEDIGVVGLDLWQVKSGTIFDNLLITDDVEAAKADAEAVLKRVEGEKKMKEAEEEEERQRLKEEADKAKDEEGDEDEDEEDEEDDDKKLDDEDDVLEAHDEL
ncbi:LOW QUALITY PROTEIN: calreticulin-like [Pollicipes pollicipes]|uniref:LOW QUALITY PROTEIN: calreticulin-like n=1 Tax=Pollicipes pollicipes TaxID=41117 RepID=UPI001884A2F0|nr:LOW QUALITY PROTEIN: calreticulin-like [Pollicipes pollicipes]